MLFTLVKWLVVVTLALSVLLGGFGYLWFQEQRAPFSNEAIERDFSLQDDTQVKPPEILQSRVSDGALQPNPQRNLYFGELHLHTSESFDSALFGNTLSIADAYRFARGERLVNQGGEVMQLSQPLDFVAITDHAEGFGSRRRCDEQRLPWGVRATCWVASTPNLATFNKIRNMGSSAEDLTRANSPYCDIVGIEQCLEDAAADWQDYKNLADEYNRPGEFTAFKAYEYSPALPDNGKYHRNVYFRGDNLPKLAVSMLDAPAATDLWRMLEEACKEDCDFFTAPHNMNRAWGLPYAPVTRRGDAYTQDDWILRAKYEPLAEIYQIKGASECAVGAFATDEECGFEQVFEVCQPGQETACAFPGGFAREGLKRGLKMEQELGVNPFKFGFIAATDSHNANPGDAEEWDFRGAVGQRSSPAVRRQKHVSPEEGVHRSIIAARSPGGLAAVWATENTRDALFDAMRSRETYGTSGTRIALRFFAGLDFPEAILSSADPFSAAYEHGVPMGSELHIPKETSGVPTFLVWAMADPRSAPLQRVQIVKGWLANGETHERVVDVACSVGSPDSLTGRCPDNAARVDLESCEATGTGASELKTLWKDPEFDAAQSAFYYVRVLQNPTCRWSSYDALRLGREFTPYASPTVTERAWSSPIWIGPTL